MTRHMPRLFALGSSRAYGERIAAQLGIALSDHEEHDFEDGERKARPSAEVRGRDVFVVDALYGEPKQSVHDKLCALFFFAAAVKDAGAACVTAVVPYVCYTRQDRKVEPGDPVATRYVAQLFEASGIDRVITIDVHNPAAFANAFRRPTESLAASPLFAQHFATRLAGADVAVVSPDIGGLKRAETLATALARLMDRKVPATAIRKHRVDHVLDDDTDVEEVGGRFVIIVDDVIGTGSTVLRAARACRRGGAAKVFVAATHGLFVGAAQAVVADPAVDRFVLTDTVPPFRVDPELARRKIELLDSIPLAAEAIRRWLIDDR
jgi:ribose-phosphate pyrophosphokinase